MSCEKIGLRANNLWQPMKGFKDKNLSVITFLFYSKDAKAFTQNWLCYICVFLTGEHMELYTKNFHELPGAEIELRGNIVLLKYIIALSVSY